MSDFDYSKLSKTLDALLGSVDLTSTTEEGAKSELPDGYYLCEVVKAELTESKSGNPMVSMQFKVMDDGKKIVQDEQGYSQLVDAPHTKDKIIYQNYVLSNELQVTFFVSDMLKFQDPETNEPLFDKEKDFDSTKAIMDVCEALEAGMIIYIMVQTKDSKNEPGKKEKKYNPISWKRASKLELL